MKNKVKTVKKTILIVDDEKDACGVICRYLKRKGFNTEEAHDGKEAMMVLKKRKPDLIILDVMMPAMDGFEFLENLKVDNKYRDIPVIMLTVKSDPKNLEKGITLKTEFYLPKPFEFNNLMNFINLILN